MGVIVRINRSNHLERIFEDVVNYSFESESLTDLMFICNEGAKRHAHQSVLSHISPLINSMKDPEKKLYISLDNVNVDVLDFLLRFLYTGQVIVPDSHKIRSLSDLCKSLQISLANTTKVPIPSTTIYCVCRQPEKGRMIGCDFCDEWYHIKCINVSRSEINVLKQQFWKCPVCIATRKKEKSVFPIKYYDDSSMSSDSSVHSDLSPVSGKTIISTYKNGPISSSDEESTSSKPHSSKMTYKDSSLVHGHNGNNGSFVSNEIKQDSKHDCTPNSDQPKASTSHDFTPDFSSNTKIQSSSHAASNSTNTLSLEPMQSTSSGISNPDLNKYISQQIYIKTETNNVLESSVPENLQPELEGDARPTAMTNDATIVTIINNSTEDSSLNTQTTRVNERNAHFEHLSQVFDKNPDNSNGVQTMQPTCTLENTNLNLITDQQQQQPSSHTSNSDHCNLSNSIYCEPSTSTSGCHYNDKPTTSNVISPQQSTLEDEKSKNKGPNNDYRKELARRFSNEAPKGYIKVRRTQEDLSFCYTCLSIFVTRKALREHQAEHHPRI